jgi:putative chitobiose transport system permease protein
VTRKIILYVILSAIAALMVGPFLWTLSTSLKGSEEVFSMPPTLIPTDVRWQNYSDVIALLPLGLFAFNSLLISLLSVVSNVLLASLAAYPLARMEFRGKKLLFLAVLSTMMIPEQVIMIPLYRVCMQLGLLNTFAGVVLPFGVNAFGIFLIRQFYRSIPRDIDDAATIDGCSPIRIWWEILVPLSRPALATLAVFTFVGSWSNFLWPLVVLRDADKMTIPIGLSMLVSTFSANYKFVAAGAVLAVIPVIIVFLVMQRAFIQGLLSGSVKS